MDDKKKSENVSKFYCGKCDFKCCKLSNYNKHIMTLKHSKDDKWITFGLQKMPEHAKKCLDVPKNDDLEMLFKCECGKEYKYRQGLWKHKQKCNLENSNNKLLINNNEHDLTNLVLELVKQNNELQKNMMKILENGTHNTTNNHTNSHNKTFNLNVFLNETCKDALNLTDFVDSLKLQLSDLEKVGELGFVNGISDIIIKNLKALDVTERPVHCTDSKRETLYIKDENKWEKENENKNKIKKAIKRVANKNITLLTEFKTKYPDCIYSDSKKSDEYNKIIIEAFELDNMEKQEKIIKKIAKEVTIEKETNKKIL